MIALFVYILSLLFFSLELLYKVKSGDFQFVKESLSSRPPGIRNLLRRDINECILEAVRQTDIQMLENLILGGSRYFGKKTHLELDVALHLAVQQDFFEGIGLLLLCKAAIDREPKLVKKLLTDPVDETRALSYVVEVREAIKSGRLKTKTPIFLSHILSNHKVNKELLLLTNLDMKKRSVDWSRLRIRVLQESWIGAISPWVLTLKANSNRIPNFPMAILQAQQLIRLELRDNCIESVPAELFSMLNLETLDLSRNGIKKLPEVPKWSPSLLILNLSENSLDTLPTSIQYSAIQMLDLSKNAYTSLPKAVCHMVNLTTLDLSYLTLADLPKELVQRKKTVIFSKNSEHTGAFARVGRSLTAKLKSKDRPNKPNYTVSMIVMGGTDQGREAVIGKLRSSKVYLLSDGALEIISWTYKKNLISSKVTFNTLIMPNDQLLSLFYPCFFHPCALYVILVEYSEKYTVMEQIRIPMALLQRYIPQANIQFVYLLPPKLSTSYNVQEDKELMRLQTVRKGRADYQGFVFHEIIIVTDELTGSSMVTPDPRPKFLEAAFNMKVDDAGVLGVEFPESYFSLIDAVNSKNAELQNQGRPSVLNEDQVWELVEKSCKGEKPVRSELPIIISFLELVGSIVHFNDPNEGLKDYFFVCACWLLENLSGVIDKVGQLKKLVVNATEIRHISESQIPSYLFGPIMRILARYTIALPISRTQYILPFLLPKSNDGIIDSQKLTLRRQFSPNTKMLPCDIWHRIVSIVATRFKDIVMHNGDKRRHPTPDKKVQNTKPSLLTSTRKLENQDSFEILASEESVDFAGQRGRLTRLTTNRNRYTRAASLTEKLGREVVHIYEGRKSISENSQVGLPENLQLWESGAYYSCEPHTFLIRPCKSTYSEAGVEIASSNSELGRNVMAKLCFIMQTLLKDWYPELHCLETHRNSSLTESVHCPSCIQNNIPTPSDYVIDTMVPNARRSDTQSCSRHESHSSPLSHLLPDIYMLDIPSKYHVMPNDLTSCNKSPLFTSCDHKLFEARYDGRQVLLKQYAWSDTVSPLLSYYHLRQEATLLLSLNHPNIIQMVSIMLPSTDNTFLSNPAILLERAPHGTIRDNLLDQEIVVSRIVRYHFANQVANALVYLHKNDIIYRALRTSSVLVWSLDLKTDVSVKLSSFNRARQAYPSGLHTTKPNFPCVTAPEMHNLDFSEEYTHKIDIYAYGCLLQELMLERTLPTTPSARTQPQIKLKESFTSLYGPLVDMMHLCLKEDHSLRPEARQLKKQLTDPIFQLHQATQMLKDTATVRHSCFVSAARQIWCCCEESSGTQVFIISAEDDLSVLGSFELKYRSNCIAAFDSTVLIGLNKASLRVYDTQKYQFTARCFVTDSVTTMAVNETHAFVGQADGSLTSYERLSFPSSKSETLKIGEHPIISIVVIQDTLLVTSGGEVIQIIIDEVGHGLQIQRRWSMYPDSSDIIYALAVDRENRFAWNIPRQGLIMKMWDLQERTCLHMVNLKDILHSLTSDIKNIPKADRMLSLVVFEDTLWVSFNNGVVVILDVSQNDSPVPILWFRPHRRDTKCQLIVPYTDLTHIQQARIVTSGYGDLSPLESSILRLDVPVVSYWEALNASRLRILKNRQIVCAQ